MPLSPMQLFNVFTTGTLNSTGKVTDMESPVIKGVAGVIVNL
jgi:hypothetical protein